MHHLAVLDLDGVIADERHRTEYALRREWSDYFDPTRIKKDKVWPEGRRAYENELLTGADLVYLTGRSEVIREATVKWLKRHGFDHRAILIMRNDRHQTRSGWPLPTWKARILQELSIMYDGRVTFYEDDPAVCEAARGVPGVQVRHCTWYVKPDRLVRRAVA